MLNSFRRTRRSTGGSRERGAGTAVRPRLEGLEGRAMPAPLAPTGLAATGVSASAITLSWNASTDPTVTGYDVYEKVWVVPPHGGKGSSGGGHYVYNTLAANLGSNSLTEGGLKTGTYHLYVVTAVSSAGQSPYSQPGSGETWVGPSFPNGPNTFLLSSGALWSGPVNATAGMTTQLSLLVNGNPLYFSVLSGPSSASINPKTGVVTYTPRAGEVGTVSVTFGASDPLGAISQTIQFNVAAPTPGLATPRLSLYSTSATYNGWYQSVSPRAVGTDGVTSVSGTFAIAFNGGTGSMLNAGTYQVLATFTSADAHYGNATLLTHFTIGKASPKFSYLSAPAIAVGAATDTVSGSISAGTAVPTGEYVIMTINGVSQETPVDTYGNFATSFPTGGLPVGSYRVTYAFAGNSNFTAAATGATTLQVVPLAAPKVTLNPSDVLTTAGDGASFSASATGSPTISVQWQVSTDGGLTFLDVTGNYTATTTTLSFATSAGQSGWKYRAVFTNSAGTATTTVATLTLEGDTGGGN